MRTFEEKVKKTCAICGETFEGAPHQLYCHPCARERNRQHSRNNYLRQKGLMDGDPWEKVCRDCGMTFSHKGKKDYCPDCDTPEARRRRLRAHNKQSNAKKKRASADFVRVDGESFESKMRRKYRKLMNDMVAGVRKPRDNQERIALMEELGRIHGGASGSYGKYVAGCYEKE